VGPRVDLDTLENIYILGLLDPADQGRTIPRNVTIYLSIRRNVLADRNLQHPQRENVTAQNATVNKRHPPC
jgi:hypothetical protein